MSTLPLANLIKRDGYSLTSVNIGQSWSTLACCSCTRSAVGDITQPPSILVNPGQTRSNLSIPVTLVNLGQLPPSSVNPGYILLALVKPGQPSQPWPDTVNPGQTRSTPVNPQPTPLDRGQVQLPSANSGHILSELVNPSQPWSTLVKRGRRRSMMVKLCHTWGGGLLGVGARQRIHLKVLKDDVLAAGCGQKGKAHDDDVRMTCHRATIMMEAWGP